MKNARRMAIVVLFVPVIFSVSLLIIISLTAFFLQTTQCVEIFEFIFTGLLLHYLSVFLIKLTSRIVRKNINVYARKTLEVFVMPNLFYLAFFIYACSTTLSVVYEELSFEAVVIMLTMAALLLSVDVLLVARAHKTRHAIFANID